MYLTCNLPREVPYGSIYQSHSPLWGVHPKERSQRVKETLLFIPSEQDLESINIQMWMDEGYVMCVYMTGTVWFFIVIDSSTCINVKRYHAQHKRPDTDNCCETPLYVAPGNVDHTEVLCRRVTCRDRGRSREAVKYRSTGTKLEADRKNRNYSSQCAIRWLESTKISCVPNEIYATWLLRWSHTIVYYKIYKCHIVTLLPISVHRYVRKKEHDQQSLC